MQAIGSVILEKHPKVGSRVTGRVEPAVEAGWTKTTIENPKADSGEIGEYQILASIRQREDSGVAVRFLHEKGGFFGVVTTDEVTYIALPGSQIRLPDLQVDMPGDLIAGKADSPLIPMQSGPVQQVTDQAMILGAGLASRFVPVSGEVTGYAKPSVPLVGEESVVVHLARHLQRHGIRRILVNTYYMPDVLKAQLRKMTGLEFSFIDEDEPSGTAGGLLKALEANLVDRSRPILIMQGDAVTNANLSDLLEAHQRVQPLITIGVKTIPDEQVDQMAIVVTDQSGEDGQSGYVLSFKEKPSLAEAGPSRTGSIGFYVLAPEVLDSFAAMGRARWQQSPEYDYAMDFFPGLLAQETSQGNNAPSPIYAHRLQEPFYWSDIGRPDQYIATVRDIYAGHLGIDLPENRVDFYEQGIIYWPGAKEKAKADQAVLKGNVIVLRKPGS